MRTAAARRRRRPATGRTRSSTRPRSPCASSATRWTPESAKIEAAIGEVKEALKGTDVQAIKTAMENLIQASHKLAEQVYAQARPRAARRAQGRRAGVPLARKKSSTPTTR